MRYYVNIDSYKSTNFSINKNKTAYYDTEVELKFIQPIYEYLVIYKLNGVFTLSNNYYTNLEEFIDYVNNANEIVELYLPSKRVRN